MGASLRFSSGEALSFRETHHKGQRGQAFREKAADKFVTRDNGVMT
jgi:hypothetical protein